MKSTKLLLAACAVAGLTLFTACEETVNNITEKAEVASVTKYKELAKCEKDELGSMVYVSDSSKVFACTVDGWISMSGADGKDGKDGKDGADGNDGSDGKDGSSCTVKELDSGDGYKVVCGGDSVGVVLNGKDGADGAPGKGCTLNDSLNGIVLVTCGDSVATLYKALCGSTPYEPTKNTCVDGVLVNGNGQGTDIDDTASVVPIIIITCSPTDMFCKNNTYFVNTGLDNGSETAGIWYAYNDSADRGSSKIIWPVKLGNAYDESALDPVIDRCNGVCAIAALDEGNMTGGNVPYAGVAFNIAGVNGNGVAEPVDASSWGGICVTYTADSPMQLRMGLDKTVAVDLGYDEPYVNLPKGSLASEKCFTWDSFRQGGWGKETITGAEAATMLASLKFDVSGHSGDSVSFNIIRLKKLPDNNSSIVPPVEYVDAALCGDLWCGPSGEYQVTALSNVDGGTWQVRTDSVEDGGTSKIVWPVAIGNKYNESALDPVIDYAGGLAGGVVLGDGYKYPYAFLGFSLNDETHENYDVSNWEGVCLVYKSSLSFAVQLIPADEDTLTQYNDYKITVPKSASVKVIDLPWSKFKQESGWGKSISLDVALESVSEIAVKFSGVAGTEGGFTIYSIGKYGTCGQQ